MRLRDLRLEKGLLQKDVAGVLGVDRTTYAKYESEASEPNRDTLIRLAKYFGVSTDYLLEVTDVRGTPPTVIDEGRLDVELIERLASLTPEEQSKVDVFVQGMIASRSDEVFPPA